MGGLVDRSVNAPLAPELAKHFTVYNYDRRGRGDSGDTQPYAMEREIEDTEALIAAAPDAVHLYGVSSGGGPALEAAAAGLAVDRVAVYEVPYCIAGDTPKRAREYVEKLGPAHAEGRRVDAVELFFRLVGSSDEDIAGVKSSPYWPGLEAIAHTLAYDAACMANYQLPTARFARIAQPTLVFTGEAGMDPQPRRVAGRLLRSGSRRDRGEHPARGTPDRRRPGTRARPSGGRTAARTVLHGLTRSRSV